MKEIVVSDKAPNPVGAYNQAVVAGGFVFVSGQLPIDPKEGKIVARDIFGQTRQVMENVVAILETAGCGLNDVVFVNVYIASMALFDDFNREYSVFFGGQFPARAIAGVELKGGALVEVSVVACRG